MEEHKKVQDSGFGNRVIRKTKRTINKDGSFNAVRKGAGLFWRDAYLRLISMSWISFIGLLFFIYFGLNAVFASLYLIGGVENLVGVKDHGLWDNFLTCFYFSVQTFTTVGYGAISPKGSFTNLVAALDAFTGLLAFALATGLLYGRFSRATAKIRYSKNALIAPFEDGKALMFRIVNQRSSILMNLEARVMVSWLEEDEKGHANRQFYNLKLQLDKIYFFPMNWTIVHPLDEESPFYGKTKQEVNQHCTEILIMIKGFDDTFTQDVHSRFSYCPDEIIWDAKFKPMYHISAQGDIIVDIDSIDDFDPIN